jgi:Zn-dependent protease with chaperone function
MLHVLLIAVFVVVYVRDGLDTPTLYTELGLSRVQVALWSLAPLTGVWLLMHAYIWLQGRRIDRTGRLGAARRAEGALVASRLAATTIHGFNILFLGWLGAVRATIGDLIAIDELVACLPVLLVFCLGWWSIYPIDRRLREAVILHELDRGRALPHLPGRISFVLSSARHQMSLVLIPIIFILSWSELIQRGEHSKLLPGASPIVVQILGMLVILALMPFLLRRVWDTVALGPGELRDRLLGMCRAQRVRVRELLVWRTHGTMINGAVMGLVPLVRYILLTDALIENLPPDQVEAVTAHEIGHVRRRHLIWLAASALGSIVALSAAAEVLLDLLSPGLSGTTLAQGVIGVTSLGVGLLIFGFVSRRFEWQADAFAVQHLSGYKPGSRSGVTLTPQAVQAMSGALESVAVLNQIPRWRFTWRHGSIGTRQQKLAALTGQPADRLAIDRHARLIAIVSAFIGALAIALIVYSGVSSPPAPSPKGHSVRRVGYGGHWCDSSRCMGSGTTTSISMPTQTRS